jgi:hypothetical protein
VDPRGRSCGVKLGAALSPGAAKNWGLRGGPRAGKSRSLFEICVWFLAGSRFQICALPFEIPASFVSDSRGRRCMSCLLGIESD